mmetsp:Transcript_11737/g.26448  ORF Transcript_11737/g.26448 Transcript_11737/m.26448 type:complete len:234 (-) Transcript_11737:595-1296(-)
MAARPPRQQAAATTSCPPPYYFWRLQPLPQLSSQLPRRLSSFRSPPASSWLFCARRRAGALVGIAPGDLSPLPPWLCALLPPSLPSPLPLYVFSLLRFAVSPPLPCVSSPPQFDACVRPHPSAASSPSWRDIYERALAFAAPSSPSTPCAFAPACRAHRHPRKPLFSQGDISPQARLPHQALILRLPSPHVDRPLVGQAGIGSRSPQKVNGPGNLCAWTSRLARHPRCTVDGA